MKHLRLTPDNVADLLVWRARQLLGAPQRRLAMGIAGGPGVGKSTIAGEVVARLYTDHPGRAALLPMDGFHMRQTKLERLGTAFEKGAPHTFEGAAFAEFLAALKAATGPMDAPGYSRKVEDVVEGAYTIPAAARILIVEGNYLLLPDPPWDAVKPLLDFSVFLDLGRETAFARLLARHNAEGLFDPDYSRRHVEQVDMSNYDIVQGSRDRADLVIDLVVKR
jgi:pantothenate kinase